jgi:hypothetical protein
MNEKAFCWQADLEMRDNCRRTLCIGLICFLFIGLFGISLGQTSAPEGRDDRAVEMADREEMIPHQDEGFPMGVPVEVLYGGHGFALRGNESYLLRLKVESLLPLEAGQIQSLLQSNKSLEEIRDDIRQKEGEMVYRGSLILERSIYPLINIQLCAPTNSSTALQADLADLDLLAAADDNAVLGRIFVIISPSDGGMIGKGELNISAGPQAGKYSLLLDVEPRRGKKMMMGR